MIAAVKWIATGVRLTLSIWNRRPWSPRSFGVQLLQMFMQALNSMSYIRWERLRSVTRMRIQSIAQPCAALVYDGTPCSSGWTRRDFYEQQQRVNTSRLLWIAADEHVATSMSRLLHGRLRRRIPLKAGRSSAAVCAISPQYRTIPGIPGNTPGTSDGIGCAHTYTAHASDDTDWA